jgi:antitoxin CptB
MDIPRPETGPETHEHRLKRMRMRSWRRGTKEMDLILGPYADTRLGGMDAAALDLFDALLDENDQDLYRWVSGQAAPPDRFAAQFAELAR